MKHQDRAIRNHVSLSLSVQEDIESYCGLSKIRVWRKSTKEMIKFDVASFEHKDGDIFMTSTELKDVSGKHIFVGDIIEWRHKIDGGYQALSGVVGKTLIFQEKFLATFSIEYYAGLHWETIPFDFTRGYTIIGNAFDNPEIIDAFENKQENRNEVEEVEWV